VKDPFIENHKLTGRFSRKALIWALGGVVLFFLSLFFLERVLESGLTRDLGRSVAHTFHGSLSITSLKVGILSRTLDVREATISFPLSGRSNGQGPMTPLVRIRKVSGHFRIFSLLNRVYDIRDLSFSGVQITAVNQGGRDNFRKFLTLWSSGRHGGEEGGATVRDFRIDDSSILLLKGNGDVILKIQGLEGEIRPNLLMDRFRARFRSGPLILHLPGEILTIPRTRLSGSFDSGTLRDFRVDLLEDPSRISIEGRVTQISESPFLDLFFHGNLDLAALSSMFSHGEKTGPKTMKGALRLDGYIHGPFDRWKGKAILSGKNLLMGGETINSLSVEGHFAPFILRLDPILIDSGKRHVHGAMSAQFSGDNPGVDVDMTVHEPSPSFLGSVPMTVRVFRRIPLSGDIFDNDSWRNLWKKVMGDDFS
jgi:hypothetical protein